jgi:hypothetical protein
MELNGATHPSIAASFLYELALAADLGNDLLLRMVRI